MQTVLDTLPTMAFATACVALARKRWPTIDGWYVTLVYALLVVSCSVLAHYSAHIPAMVWTALQTLAVVVTGQGAVTLGQQIAAKGRNGFADEPATVKDLPR